MPRRVSYQPERYTTIVRQFISVALVALTLRILVASHGYSGEADPPQFGDFEAQRHWMEVTWSLPMKEWYHNSTVNNLEYWGLDYPPLSAYVSWIFGAAASKFYPPLIELIHSHGIETPATKLFMRISVLCTDVCVYFVAVFLTLRIFYTPTDFFSNKYIQNSKAVLDATEKYSEETIPTTILSDKSATPSLRRRNMTNSAHHISLHDTSNESSEDTAVHSKSTQQISPGSNLSHSFDPTSGSHGYFDQLTMVSSACIAIPTCLLFQPSFILVDHGHFQYNNVYLGLVQLAILSLTIALSRLLQSTDYYQTRTKTKDKTPNDLSKKSYDQTNAHSNTWIWPIIAAACTFSMALNFKQMTIYFVPGFMVAIGLIGLSLGIQHFTQRQHYLNNVSHNIQSKRIKPLWISKCLTLGQSLGLLFLICLLFIAWATFIQWMPFCFDYSSIIPWNIQLADASTCRLRLGQVLYRIFPLSRGIFEDKVASIWGGFEPFLRIRRSMLLNVIDQRTVLYICSLATFIFLIPLLLFSFHQLCRSWKLMSHLNTNIIMHSTSKHPEQKKETKSISEKNTSKNAPNKNSTISMSYPLKLNFMNSENSNCFLVINLIFFLSSIAFFLGSYQVHEKTILLPLLPATNLLCFHLPFSNNKNNAVKNCTHSLRLFSLISLFSLIPLLQRDGQIIPLWIAIGAHIWSCRTLWLNLQTLFRKPFSNMNIAFYDKTIKLCQLSLVLVTILLFILHVGAFYIPPPSHWPDLIPQLTATLCVVGNLAIFIIVSLTLFNVCVDDIQHD